MVGLYFPLLASLKISKVIVFTATPCHVWHPGPDATLLIVWRRWRTWTVMYLVFLQASWSHLPSPQISKVIVFTATPCHVWHPGPDAALLIIWMRRRVWMQVYLLVLCTATPSAPPPPGSICSPSPVQTPHSAHSVHLLLLLMLIVPLYFIAVFTVQEKPP